MQFLKSNDYIDINNKNGNITQKVQKCDQRIGIKSGIKRIRVNDNKHDGQKLYTKLIMRLYISETR